MTLKTVFMSPSWFSLSLDYSSPFHARYCICGESSSSAQLITAKTRLVNDTINLWMGAAKVLFEAFPQSTMAMFCFGNCKPANDSSDALIGVFNASSFIAFMLCFAIFVAIVCFNE